LNVQTGGFFMKSVRLQFIVLDEEACMKRQLMSHIEVR